MRFLIFLACNAPSQAEPEAPTADTGGRVLYGPEPVWGATEAAAAIDAILSEGIPDPQSILDLYVHLRDVGGTDACPGPGYTFTQPFNGCTSSMGYRFAGLATYQPVNGAFLLHGDCTITDPQGITFYCGGEISFFHDPGGPLMAEMEGTWGAATEAAWLGAVPSLALWVNGDNNGYQLDGGYTLADTSIYFDAVSVTRECHGMGRVNVRGPEGLWYNLELANSCDGCGTVYQRDTSLGTACIALGAALSDWEMRL